MNQDRSFLKIAAIAGFVTAVTTFLLWLLPKFYAPPATFDEGILLHKNSAYLAKQWVNFLHIPFALLAYFGLTVLLVKRQAVKAIFGMLWFGIWGAVEMSGVAIILFSVNYNWRTTYETADMAQKVALRTNIEGFYSVWDSLFFVLLIAFLLGTLFFGWATWRSKGLEKILSYLFWMAVPLTLLIILDNYANQSWAGQLTKAVYPILQPVSRFILGLFLWKQSTRIEKEPSKEFVTIS
ncbi:hypothetical protein IC229_33085 [Spirosoma sp. BT702]|uniref:Uncharacterized protein n=1 Tax=Spirosoma profusum TaxID=2771354 RepID=A0A927AW16_9BACT|nr:hypothetical protein [Spirosoma profusum]MBD2705493.1 hypothetical protein [Spirosoma profusum]